VCVHTHTHTHTVFKMQKKKTIKNINKNVYKKFDMYVYTRGI